VRKVCFVIRNRVDIEKHRAGNVCGVVFALRVAARLRQIPRRIRNAQVRIGEPRREILGGDEGPPVISLAI